MKKQPALRVDTEGVFKEYDKTMNVAEQGERDIARGLSSIKKRRRF